MRSLLILALSATAIVLAVPVAPPSDDADIGLPIPTEPGFPNPFPTGTTGSLFPIDLRSDPGASGPTSIDGQLPSLPTGLPSSLPFPPQGFPTSFPTGLPSGFPNSFPTGLPSGFPTGLPSGFPTGLPSGFPNSFPTGLPTGFPTSLPFGSVPGFPSFPPASQVLPTSEPVPTDASESVPLPTPTVSV